MRMKLLVRRGLLFVNKNNTVIVRFEILPWLYGPEKCPGLSRKGPLQLFLVRLSKPQASKLNINDFCTRIE